MLAFRLRERMSGGSVALCWLEMAWDKSRNRMKARCWVSIVLLLLSMLVAPWVASAQGGGPSADVNGPLVLSMDTVYGHYVVELVDRSLGKLRVVVDTGAERTMLSGTVAAKAKVDRHFTDRFYIFYGFGKGKKARLKGHTKLELGSADRTLAAVDAFVVDLGILATGMTPAPDGILGWDFFQHVCVRLDPKAQRMSIGPGAHCPMKEDGFYAPPVQWLDEGLLMPVTVTLANGHALKLKLHVDTGSDSILLGPRLRREVGLEKKPKGKAEYQGTGMNGSYPWDMVYAVSLEADGGHPEISGKFPIMVPWPGGFSQPNWLFAGKNEALMSHDGVVGTSMLDRFALIFDPVEKKIYARADTYAGK